MKRQLGQAEFSDRGYVVMGHGIVLRRKHGERNWEDCAGGCKKVMMTHVFDKIAIFEIIYVPREVWRNPLISQKLHLFLGPALSGAISTN